MLGRPPGCSSWVGQATAVAGTSLTPSHAAVASVAYSCSGREENPVTLSAKHIHVHTGTCSMFKDHFVVSVRGQGVPGGKDSMLTLKPSSFRWYAVARKLGRKDCCKRQRWMGEEFKISQLNRTDGSKKKKSCLAESDVEHVACHFLSKYRRHFFLREYVATIPPTTKSRYRPPCLPR